jgi:hypothetical protein
LRVCSVISITRGLNGIGKNMKDFNLFGIEIHTISPNIHGLRVKRTGPEMDANLHNSGNGCNLQKNETYAKKKTFPLFIRTQ